MDLIGTLFGLFSGGASIIWGVLAAIVGLVGMFFRVKALGRKEVRDAMQSKLYKKAYEEEKRRREMDANLEQLSDDELERLRNKYSWG